MRVDSIFQTPERSISGFPAGVTDLEVDEEGNVFLLAPAKHRIFKLFRFTGYDSIQTIGGKGIGEEGFNFPSQIIVPNRQKLYLLDQENRRIVLLNTNLKVLDDLNFLNLEYNQLDQDEEFLFPVRFTVAPTGDLFVLNQENLRIYKINTFAQIETIFGGLDYGDGSLREPSGLAADDQNNVFVGDSSQQLIRIFDLYGTYRYSIYPTPPFRWRDFTLMGKYVICFEDHHLYFQDLLTRQESWLPLEGEEKILDVEVSRDFIYILFEKHIHLYRISRNQR